MPISDSDRAQIKNVLVDLMLSVESSISKTLASALSIISEIEFPHDWQTLLPVCTHRHTTHTPTTQHTTSKLTQAQQLVSKFGTQDWTLINNVLKTIHSILRRYSTTFFQTKQLTKFLLENRYRHQFRSETILGELKYILGQLQKPYHDLFMVLYLIHYLSPQF